METSTVVAPALSTTQGDETFEFSKTSSLKFHRDHLGPDYAEKKTDELRNRISDYYTVPDIVKYLSQRDSDGKFVYRTATLQFPDSLVSDSAVVLQQIQEGLEISANEYKVKNKETSSEDYDKTHTHSHEHKHEHKQEGDGNHSADISEIDLTHLSKTKGKSCDSNKPQDIESVHVCKGTCGGACKNKEKKDQKQNVWILADTSYSPCCVDEVAAGHVGADIVIHFGNSCLSPIQKLPAAYVFGRPYVNIEELKKKIEERYDDKDSKVVLMSSTPFCHVLHQVYLDLIQVYPNLRYADIDLETFNKDKKSVIIGHDQHSNSITDEFKKNSIRQASRVIYGFNKDEIINIEEDSEIDQLTQEYSLFHIDEPASPRLLTLSTKFSDITTYNASTSEISTGPYPSLMRRYRYMHVARNSGTIGILVNTLSLANTGVLLNKTIKWIRNAGKKHYMFVVGKPNVAKLANFENIEVWVVLGCGESGIIIDEVNDYYRPIITPYELQLALNYEVTWTGKWITDFKDVMSQEGYKDENMDDAHDETTDSKDGQENDDDSDDDIPQFNPVTGSYVSTAKPLRRLNHLQIDIQNGSDTDSSNAANNEQNQLVKKFSSNMIIKGAVSTSAMALQNREWTGLGSDYKNDEDYDEEGAEIEEGASGIARGYDFDNASTK
ncbi:hypothetical protein B5S33_g1717 [[Candida] boidinii]|nr:hypothetical protein B5S30_g268 [[Candida] boidinii]OWB83088.1 hypothetical protein B5S33_g1717 [[Candida] boidinii]